MWIQILIAFIAIEMSEEGCDRYPIYSRWGAYGAMYRAIHCSDITPDFNINGRIKSDAMHRDVSIERSNLPELTGNMFQNITVENLKIRTNVKTIRSKTFENSTMNTLNLDDNHITEIEDFSFESSSTVSLSLLNNNLTRINTNAFHGLQTITQLSIKQNRITYIEENSFDSLTNLVQLDLSYNMLSKLEGNLFRVLTNLDTIYLNDNQLTELDDMFYDCKSLTNLFVGNNLIAKLEGKRYPHSLLHIYAKNNTLKSVHFSSLPNLKTIDFSFNKLISVTEWSHALVSLEILYLSYNLIGPFIESQGLSQLENLTVIEMDRNGLLDIDIGMLNNFLNLQKLSLSQNLLRNFTVSDFGVHLNSLNLSKNYVSKVENLSIMEDLQILDLSYNHLQEIEFHMFDHMSKLKYLALEYNAIHTIHMGCFKDLQSLENLALSHNEISAVDIGSFSGVNALTVLDISYNNITHLDENVFHNLKKLTRLNIAHNKLNNAELKTLLSHTPFLKQIDVAGNKWTCNILGEIVKGKISLIPGSDYSVTNVLGIPCTKNISVPTTQSESLVNASGYYDSIKEISYKMSMTNVVLIILFILLCIKLCFATCFSGYNAARRYFDQKYKQEHEMLQI